MATLVFSTVGTILGGPIGGAIGALIGQSIDDQLLGPSQRGPKIGDLTVQTSTYGTQVPRVYGAMRVAGSVVWSTDLIQSDETSGAKGQPDVTYSYKVSFAVALSSRPVLSVGRIWADGKLLRGAAGDFKVPVTFRLYSGDEDQGIDPLIASIEGIDATPAYRGLALAVFEDLELAEYGNRIPFLTFEVFADEPSPTAGAILTELSAAAIVSDVPCPIVGYAAYGASIRAAADPIIGLLGLPLFDDGTVIRAATDMLDIAVRDDELGQSLDQLPAAKWKRERRGGRDLPARLRLAYYDPAREYQSGEARASAGDAQGKETRIEVPAVVDAGEAKSLAHERLASAWAGNERLVLRLPPARMAIEPGSTLMLPLSPSRWRVDKVEIEGFIAALELTPVMRAPLAATPADPGRVSAAKDEVAGEITLALIEAPAIGGDGNDAPVVYIAASSEGSAWTARTVQFDCAGLSQIVSTARRKAIIGSVTAPLAAGECDLVDMQNMIEVQLVDANQWLTSCTLEDAGNGQNLAMIGHEILQFMDAEPIGPGRFRLSALLRGRAGTEHRVAGHASGERFILLDPASLVTVALPAWTIGGTATVTEPRSNAAAEIVVGAASIRPLSPVRLSATLDTAGMLDLEWTRRSRRGWAWIDGVDAPLGEANEHYRVIVTDNVGGSIVQECDATSLTLAANATASLGARPWTVSVQQIGEFAVSEAAQAVVDDGQGAGQP